MKNIYWKGYTSLERHFALEAIQSVVSRFGCIINAVMFSDVAVTLVIEIEANRIDQLYQELQQLMAMDAFQKMDTIATKEKVIYCTITFSKATGNLKNEVSNVPG
ncbi:hypothetical protein [Flavobacterium sp. TSSA_36]|uniref:hypothetical protein n=1 Tax=Flavobacterium sp. TSSA_36 TaxID=3447669 RepID=UPI003F3A2EC8